MEALKEWATVVRALEDGKQTVILRKGGILETSSGFNIEAKKFLLFPTYEHQDFKNLKPKFHNYLINLKKPIQENRNQICSYAEILHEKDIESEKKISALSSFHIWSDSYVNERMNWMPNKPLKAIFLKIYKIPQVEIPIKPEYHGCKSWININEEIQKGKAVLNQVELEDKLKQFREIVN